MISLAHHWLISERGGEKVLKSFSKLFPDAPIYTLVAINDRSGYSDWLDGHRIVTSLLQCFPGATRHYKKFLPFFPVAVSRMKVSNEDKLILSSDASVIKGLKVPKDSVHVCYCHSPPRYLWSMQETYIKQSSGLGFIGRNIFRAVTPYVKSFDLKSAIGVDHFIANSAFVAERIKQCYGRHASVIYPPVSLDDFIFSEEKEDFYLVVSELVPYKRIDLAVEAFSRSGKHLVVIGEGSERESLEARAASNVEFLGRQPFSVLREAYSKCRAFIFPGIEDFGITPLEAQASGSPVIAYGEGGALETVIDGKTGLFFQEQTVEALIAAVEALEKLALNALDMRKNAERFSQDRFCREIKAFLYGIAPEVMRATEGR